MPHIFFRHTSQQWLVIVSEIRPNHGFLIRRTLQTNLIGRSKRFCSGNQAGRFIHLCISGEHIHSSSIYIVNIYFQGSNRLPLKAAWHGTPKQEFTFCFRGGTTDVVHQPAHSPCIAPVPGKLYVLQTKHLWMMLSSHQSLILEFLREICRDLFSALKPHQRGGSFYWKSYHYYCNHSYCDHCYCDDNYWLVSIIVIIVKE